MTTRRTRRRDAALLAWLTAHPDADAAQAATALGWPVYRTHRTLRRLHQQGRVRTSLTDGPFFVFTVYAPTSPLYAAQCPADALAAGH